MNISVANGLLKKETRPDYLFYVIEGKAKIYVTHQNGKTSLLNLSMSMILLGKWSF